MNRKRFERLVERALGRIPETFRAAMDNMAIIVEDWPSAELMDAVPSKALAPKISLPAVKGASTAIEISDWSDVAGVIDAAVK